ncbi:MAG: hypothetical protein JW861_11575 [Bacteroidales bacterium]|nr:hypothetical protein [Bacteroidales bacterium]
MNRRLPDGGPLYTETDLDRMLAEPWNAFSSMLIVIPAVYWAIRLKGLYGQYRFLTFCLPLVITGGLGSALFHAFRVSRFFLFMDIIPAALMTLSVGIYFWYKLLGRWHWVAGIIALSFALRWLIFSNLSRHTAINLSYAVSGVLIALPLLVVLFRTKGYGFHIAVITIGLFMIALLFRELDPKPVSWLPMGSHFLWHAFSGAGAYFMLLFLFRFRQKELLSGDRY